MKKGWFDEFERLAPFGAYQVYRGYYTTADGERVVAYSVLPVQPNGEVLLYLRGGIRHVGDVRLPRLLAFAAAGYTVVAPVYRGNHGGSGREDFGKRDLEDVLALYDRVASAKAVHAFGFSRGGMMALLLASERPLNSVVSWAGVSDLSWTYEERLDLRPMLRRVTGGTPEQVEHEYAIRSPKFRTWTTPTLLIHGNADRQVPIRHAHVLMERRQEQIELWEVDGGHHIPFWEKQQLTRRALRWMAGFSQ